MRAPFNGCDHRHAYVGDIFDNLNAFIMNLAPNAWISNVAEGWKIDAGNELPACSRQDHDLVLAILRDSVKSIDELRMVLRGENERAAVGMKLHNQHTCGVSCQLDYAQDQRFERWYTRLMPAVVE